MSDIDPVPAPVPETPPTPELKQSRTMGKAAARDAKRLRNNANRNLEAPDMPDTEKEREIAERISKKGNRSSPASVVRLVLKLAEKGYSPSQMHLVSKLAPIPQTIYRWMREDPDIGEEIKSRYRSFVDDAIRQALPVSIGWQKDAKRLRRNLSQARKLATIDGLKPFERVQAIDRMLQRITDLTTAAVAAEDRFVHRSLQIAGRQIPAEWGQQATGDSGTIVIDVGLGFPIKTQGLPGTPDGQNVKALEAGRWKALPSPEDVGKSVQGVQKAQEEDG